MAMAGNEITRAVRNMTGRALEWTGRRLRGADGLSNPVANLGGSTVLGYASNALAAGGYEFDRLTLAQVMLCAAYRGSWLVAMACDAPAEDMTKAGIEPQGQIPPEQWTIIDRAATALDLWPQAADWIRWGRLFGGSVLIPSIDGQDPATPLRPESVAVGQLRGFDVFDRWRIVPDYASRLSVPGRNRGMFEFYNVVGDGVGTPNMRVHHSRIIRHDAAPLPYRERMGNSMWGMSIIERLYPIIRAHDSTVMATAQLVLRAHLRVLKVPGFLDLFGQNAKAFEGFQRRMQDMRLFQSSENITVIDANEAMDQLTPVFSGLDKILEQQANQVCGAIEIPEVRVFRKSASGLNASDEWALNCYYDDNHTRQKNTLTGPVMRLYDLISRHAIGEGLPEDFAPEFRHLSKPNPEKRATVATAVTGVVLQAYDAGLITPKCALQELRQSAQDTGLFTNITDEDIEAAADMPPKAGEGDGGEPDGDEGNNVIDLDKRRNAQ